MPQLAPTGKSAVHAKTMQSNELQTLVHDPLQCWFDIMWTCCSHNKIKISHKIRLQAQVRLPDGQQRTFDASSVKKMIESPEKEVSEFLGSRFSTANVKKFGPAQSEVS